MHFPTQLVLIQIIRTYQDIHNNEVKKQVEDMIIKDIIKPSQSPYNFPLCVIPKKMDASRKVKWCVFIDYRKLNDITIGDKYVMPQTDQILSSLGQSRYF